MARGEIAIVHDDAGGRIVVVDSLTYCDERVGGQDVVVAGSFAGTLAFGFALARGDRALIAHDAGIGRDRAGIAGLALGDRVGVAAAAVATMSARLGDGRNVYDEGVIAHVNTPARALGISEGLAARAAAARLLSAPPGHPVASVVDRRHAVVLETADGRVVLMGSASFADARNRRDVVCVGSHAGRVNTDVLCAIRPRGAIFNDGGLARDRSGVSGLEVLDRVGVAAVAVDAHTARIGDARSTWESGVVSALNREAGAAGVDVGMRAAEAARCLLRSRSGA